MIFSEMKQKVHSFLRAGRANENTSTVSKLGNDDKEVLTETLEFHRGKIFENQTNALLHYKFAEYAFKCGLYYLAFSELKTAMFLGIDSPSLDEFKANILNFIEDPLELDHNQYYRYETLRKELVLRAENPQFSVLDVGGGLGQLATFIPDADYCLAEPTVNGLSGLELPFDDEAFDYIVSCHVLEHIEKEDRDAFLDQLISKAKKGVILLNPFDINGLPAEERLNLVIDITNADWAKEHIDCGLPTVEELEDYAARRDLRIEIKPNGSISTTLAMVFVSYFGISANQADNVKKINKLYNESFSSVLDSDRAPTAYLIYLEKKANAK